jgi:hypothetical protein
MWQIIAEYPAEPFVARKPLILINIGKSQGNEVLARRGPSHPAAPHGPVDVTTESAELR